MTWIKLADTFPEHPKLEGVSDAAAWLYVAGLCYCSRLLTDGRIPKGRALKLTQGAGARTIGQLVAAGLWDETPDGYEVHDYLGWQTSRDEAEAKREYERDKKRGQRAKSKAVPKVSPGDAGDMSLTTESEPETHTPPTPRLSLIVDPETAAALAVPDDGYTFDSAITAAMRAKLNGATP